MQRNLLIAAFVLMSVLGASGADARSYYPTRLTVSTPSFWNVWVAGAYVGSDPDVSIRTTLLKQNAWMN